MPKCRYCPSLKLRWPALIATFALLSTCAAPYPKGGLSDLYRNGIAPSLKTIEVDKQALHYAEYSGPGKTNLLFIHGSPGDWQAWAAYLNHPDLSNFGTRRAVDRPGFGDSNDGIITDLRQQAALLAYALPENGRSIVISHSLGGPIAAWLAIDYPDSVCGVVSIAGSLAPELEGLRWYNKIANWRWLQPFIPDSLLESNREVIALKDELLLLEASWPQMQRPFFVLQGMKDKLVKPATANYLESVVDDQWLTVKRYFRQGHFLLWDSPELVVDAVRDLDQLHCR